MKTELYIAVVAATLLLMPSQAGALAIIGATFDKDIDATSGGVITPGELVTATDSNGDLNVNIQESQANLTLAVSGGAAVIDGVSLINRDTSVNPEVRTFVVSFADNETLLDSSLSVQDEDLVLVETDGTTFTSSLFLDFTAFLTSASATGGPEVDAVHVLSTDGSGGGEVLVSFDKDITNFFAVSQFNGSVALGKEDAAKVTFTSSTVITDRSLFFDIDDSGGGNFSGADLDALSIQEDGSVIASFASKVNSILDHDVHLLSSAGTGIEGSTITTSTLFLNNTGVNTNVNLTGLFETAIPEPASLGMAAVALAAPLAWRRRLRIRRQNQNDQCRSMA